MAPGRQRDERKEREWRRWVEQWQGSGLSVRAFCARHGLAEPSFYAWRRRLGPGGGAPAFVPVRIAAEPAADAAYPFEVVLAGGRRLRVAAGADRATLGQLLAVLEGGPSC
jgi:transposase-like protein